MEAIGQHQLKKWQIWKYSHLSCLWKRWRSWQGVVAVLRRGTTWLGETWSGSCMGKQGRKPPRRRRYARRSPWSTSTTPCSLVWTLVQGVPEKTFFQNFLAGHIKTLIWAILGNLGISGQFFGNSGHVGHSWAFWANSERKFFLGRPVNNVAAAGE